MMTYTSVEISFGKPISEIIEEMEAIQKQHGDVIVDLHSGACNVDFLIDPTKPHNAAVRDYMRVR